INPSVTWISRIAYEEPAPIAKSAAYRLVAAFVDEHPEEFEHFGDPKVVPVYREVSPIESTIVSMASDLTNLLTILTTKY
ncbi:hypothetical protein, partial [Acinetobacter baumannii]|uniref:hypothetical protein n=1 Tax=Acinetobacter baumannii TaxID=470 RepID=UPI0037CA0E85